VSPELDLPAARPPSPRYGLLDAVRGLAILGIACYHVLGPTSEAYGRVLGCIIRHGYMGIAVFFVISGYGIASSLDESLARGESAPAFLWRRFRRIYLPYWWHLPFAALLIPLASAAVSMLKTHAWSPNLAGYSWKEWLGIVTLLKVFTAPSWSLNLAFLPLNGCLWYVAIIVQIYVATAAALCFGRKCSAALFSLFVASLLTLVPAVLAAVPFGLFLPFFCQFYVGMIVYKAVRAGRPPRSAAATAIVAALAGALAAGAAWYGPLELPACAGVTGAALWWLHAYDPKVSGHALVRPLGVLGVFSYSLYLLHVPLWGLAAMFARNLVPLPAAVSTPLLVLPCIMLCSAVWYLFFERPAGLAAVAKGLRSPLKTLSGLRHLGQAPAPGGRRQT
jgi:peptidoglycan/LPS O-acetylase OafA/YrhL